MRSIVCFGLLAMLACNSALAQTTEGRRRMYPIQDGFLEVDTRTGAITECKRAADGYRCERVTEGDALLKEDGPQAQSPTTPRQSPRAAEPPVGPTDQEIDRALDVMERFLRRFMNIVREQRPERT